MQSTDLYYDQWCKDIVCPGGRDNCLDQSQEMKQYKYTNSDKMIKFSMFVSVGIKTSPTHKGWKWLLSVIYVIHLSPLRDSVWHNDKMEPFSALSVGLD